MSKLPPLPDLLKKRLKKVGYQDVTKQLELIENGDEIYIKINQQWELFVYNFDFIDTEKKLLNAVKKGNGELYEKILKNFMGWAFGDSGNDEYDNIYKDAKSGNTWEIIDGSLKISSNDPDEIILFDTKLKLIND